MIYKFFSEQGIQPQSLSGLMRDFRDFRHKLDTERVETKYSDPDTGEPKP
jgi:hypothetical protein